MARKLLHFNLLSGYILKPLNLKCYSKLKSLPVGAVSPCVVRNDPGEEKSVVPPPDTQPEQEVSLENMKGDKFSIYSELKNKDSFIFKPLIPTKSSSLATYVNDSITLQNLIKLGVDLTKIEMHVSVAEYLVKSNFKTDIQPYILFLHDHKIPAVELANIFNKNPKIFLEPLENLEIRINYLVTKKFSDESIAKIIVKVPTVLTNSTLITDKQLGFLQTTFNLTGDEVRCVITKLPKLLEWNQRTLEENKLHLNDIMGFKPCEIKSILLTDPKLLLSGKLVLAQRFDYLHNVMGLSHEVILEWPRVLRTRLHIIKQRHGFLKFLGRDQFNKKLENYISLHSLVALNDVDFCNTVAKISISQYNDYLKTL